MKNIDDIKVQYGKKYAKKLLRKAMRNRRAKIALVFFLNLLLVVSTIINTLIFVNYELFSVKVTLVSVDIIILIVIGIIYAIVDKSELTGTEQDILNRLLTDLKSK